MEKSFATIDREEERSGNVNFQLNSTAYPAEDSSFLAPKTPKRGDITISPILRSEECKKNSYGRRMLSLKNRGESPLVKQPAPLSLDSPKNEFESGYTSSRERTFDSSTPCSKENFLKTPARSKSLSTSNRNPFESRLLESIHTSTHSPNLCEPGQSPLIKAWPIEHRAVLCPANITDEDIRQSRPYYDHEYELQISRQLDVYWESGVGYVPSPDGPRQLVEPSPSIASTQRTRPLDSPYSARPLTSRRRVVAMRHTNSQTDLTIPVKFDFDIAKILGEQFVYDGAPEQPEEEFNVSVMNTSLPRRLFSEENSFLTDDTPEEPEDPDQLLTQLRDLGSPTRHHAASPPFPELDLSPIRGD